MEKLRPTFKNLLSRMAGFEADEAETDLLDDIELLALLNAVAELEMIKRSGVTITLH